MRVGLPAATAKIKIIVLNLPLHWLVIGIVLLTFPPNEERPLLVYGFAVLATLYNLSRYAPALLRLSRDNKSERKRLFTLVNSLNDAIFLLDAKGRIKLHNGAAQALFEAPPHDNQAPSMAALPMTVVRVVVSYYVWQPSNEL